MTRPSPREKVRRLYVEGVAIREIIARTGCPLRTLYECLAGLPSRRDGGRLLATKPYRRKITPKDHWSPEGVAYWNEQAEAAVRKHPIPGLQS